VLTCRPALPLSRQTLPLVSWTIGRQRKAIDSRQKSKLSCVALTGDGTDQPNYMRHCFHGPPYHIGLLPGDGT
jgi:hypothetical protein